MPTWVVNGRGEYTSGARLQPFTPVQRLRSLPGQEYEEVRLAEGSTFIVNSRQLARGNEGVARDASCQFYRGPNLQNNQVITQRRIGPHRITVQNMGGKPAMVSFRSSSGQTVLAMYVGPSSVALLGNFPDGRYQLETQSGDLWSHWCRKMVGNATAQRFPTYDVFQSTEERSGAGIYATYTSMTYTITPVVGGMSVQTRSQLLNSISNKRWFACLRRWGSRSVLEQVSRDCGAWLASERPGCRAAGGSERLEVGGFLAEVRVHQGAEACVQAVDLAAVEGDGGVQELGVGAGLVELVAEACLHTVKAAAAAGGGEGGGGGRVVGAGGDGAEGVDPEGGAGEGGADQRGQRVGEGAGVGVLILVVEPVSLLMTNLSMPVTAPEAFPSRVWPL